MPGNFLRRCVCGTLVRLPSIKSVVVCDNCTMPVRIKSNSNDDESNSDPDQPVTISPLVD